MKSIRPTLRPSKGYAAQSNERTSRPRPQGIQYSSGKGGNYGGRQVPQDSSKSESTSPPSTLTANSEVVSAPKPSPIPSGSTDIDAFVGRLIASDRAVMDEFASAVVAKLSRKDLVFFITRMKKSLVTRSEKENKPNAEESAAAAVAALEPKAASASKSKDKLVLKPAKRAERTEAAEDEISKRQKVEPPTTRQVPAGEFFPVTELRNRVGAITTKRQQEVLPEKKRTREEDEEFSTTLGLIESKLFFDDANELLVDELHELVGEINPLCRKVKDYLMIWQAIHVPQTRQAVVAAEILKLSPENIDGASVLATLTKNMKFKLNQVSELFEDKSVLDSAPTFLGKIYPTPKTSFGWSRIGWGFSQWLQFVEKTLANAPAKQRLDYLNSILKVLNDFGVEWDEERKESVWESAAKLSETSASELKEEGALTF